MQFTRAAGAADAAPQTGQAPTDEPAQEPSPSGSGPLRRGADRVRAWAHDPWALTSGFLILLLAVVVIGGDFGVFTPDTKPEMLLQPAQTAQRFAAAWLDTPNLGASNYNVGVAPVAAAFAVLDAVGVPGWLIARLWRFGLLLCAALGARLVIREVAGETLTPTGRQLALLGGAVAYVANPYLVVGGSTTPTMLPYALLPWLVVCWFRGARAPSWRWAIAAALVLAAMSGLNAGVVPILQLVVIIPVVLHVCLIEGVRFRTVAWLIVRTGLVYTVLSAYWLGPALAALSVGTSIAEATESIDAINMANSFPEVLRGLGMWTLYGADGNGWFAPEQLAYLVAPFVIVMSFGGPIIAGLGVRLSNSPGRLFGAVSVLIGALIMVGSFPFQNQSLWGRFMLDAINTVPGLIAFRTTNKAGAVLELGLAVLIGLGVAGVAAACNRFGSWRALRLKIAAACGAALVAVGSVFPAFTGDLFWVPMDLPKYWQDAADEVNARGSDSRVLMLPGTGLPAYSWGYSGPDEIGPSLFTRPFVFRSASPSGGVYASNLLAGTDLRLQQGTVPPGTVSTLAAYLGAGDVVGRYDVRDAALSGGRVERQLAADPGLGPVTGFGPASAARGAENPATVRPVAGTVPSTSAAIRRAQGALIVDGGGGALPDLQAAGLLQGRPGLLLAGSMDDEALARSLRDGGRVVLTDSNGNREASNHKPEVTGPLLPASTTPRATRALFSTGDQTVAMRLGNADVTTRGRGQLFGPHPGGGVEQAFDNDHSTSWLFGNFGSGVGNAVTITPDRPVAAGPLELAPMQGVTNRIVEARVSATVDRETVTRQVRFEPWNSFPARADLGRGSLRDLTVEVTKVVGDSASPVGFSEISIPGVTHGKAGQMPDTLSGRLPRVARAAERPLGEVPIDIVMRRSAGDARGQNTEEARLHREFTTPDRRSFEVSGSVRIAPGISDDKIDAFAGVRSPVVAQSSSRAFNNPELRASSAFDSTGGDPDLSTAWIPNDPVVGEWISLKFPSRRLSSFTVTQASTESFATKALVSVNDGEPFQVELGPGQSTVRLPKPTDATRVRMLIAEREGTGFVRIADIGLPDVPRPGTPPSRCVTVGSVDGTAVQANISAVLPDLLEGKSVPLRSCGSALRLDAGRHTVGSVADFAIDDLRLAGAGASGATASAERASVPPAMTVLRHDQSSMELRLGEDCSPCLVSSGQAFDPRWEATLRGASLGAPSVVDAYAAGWRITGKAGDVVRIAYGPATGALVWWLVSAVGVLGCLLLLAAPPWWGERVASVLRLRRRSTPRTDTQQTLAKPAVASGVRRARWAAVSGAVLGVLAVAVTVGWWAAAGAAAIFVIGLRVSPAHRRYLASVAVILLALVPIVWFGGSFLPLDKPASRIQDNVVAHQVGGLAIWMVVFAVWREVVTFERNKR